MEKKLDNETLIRLENIKTCVDVSHNYLEPLVTIVGA